MPTAPEPRPSLDPESEAEIRRQCREIARSPEENEDLAFWESVSILSDDDHDGERDRLP